MSALYDVAQLLMTLWSGHMIGEWIADIRADNRDLRRLKRMMRRK